MFSRYKHSLGVVPFRIFLAHPPRGVMSLTNLIFMYSSYPTSFLEFRALSMEVIEISGLNFLPPRASFPFVATRWLESSHQKKWIHQRLFFMSASTKECAWLSFFFFLPGMAFLFLDTRYHALFPVLVSGHNPEAHLCTLHKFIAKI